MFGNCLQSLCLSALTCQAFFSHFEPTAEHGRSEYFPASPWALFEAPSPAPDVWLWWGCSTVTEPAAAGSCNRRFCERRMPEHVQLTIDGQPVTVPAETTIWE